MSEADSGATAGWCQPKDCGKPTPRKFMLLFDDPDHSTMYFDDEAEARAAFERKDTAWNCYLFGAMPAIPDAAQARIAELESNEAAYERILGKRTYNEVAEHIRGLEAALKSISSQCSNVIFNCEQRPADNERHLSSWRAVKEYADAALRKDQSNG